MWTISRDGFQDRTVTVEVSAGRLRYGEPPNEAWVAIATRGRYAVEAVLDEETPPERLKISESGVSSR